MPQSFLGVTIIAGLLAGLSASGFAQENSPATTQPATADTGSLADVVAKLELSAARVTPKSSAKVVISLHNKGQRPVKLGEIGSGTPETVGFHAGFVARSLLINGKAASASADDTSRSLTLAPGAIIGAEVDLGRLVPGVLDQPGQVSIRFLPQVSDAAGQGIRPVDAMLKVGRPAVVMETTHGRLRIELDPDLAPLTVANFVELCESGFYETSGNTFHRIISGFMIQGGSSDGMGAAGRLDGKKIPHEGKPGVTRHQRGTISMARTADPNSASSQFFICHADTPHLDPTPNSPGYTAFGKIVGDESFQTLDRIATVKVNGERPAEPVKILKTRVE